MGLFKSVLGAVTGSTEYDNIQELKAKMMNSAIANDFETWFEAQLASLPLLFSQYNYYDDCKRLVLVSDDYVGICLEIPKAGIKEDRVCGFSNTLGYKPLTANGLTYSNGKKASERVLLKAFAEVAKEKMQKVFATVPGEYKFGSVEYDDGTDKNASYLERISQKVNTYGFGEEKLEQFAGFEYEVPKHELKSAF